MGWGTRIIASLVCLLSLGLGAWPISLLALAYLAYSAVQPRMRRSAAARQGVIQRRRRPWGRYLLGTALILLAFVAVSEGGTLSPAVFFLAGVVVFAWPALGRAGFGQVSPVRESILLRSRLLPWRWYAVAEVKLESADQARGMAALDGSLVLFAGRAPSALQIVSAFALSAIEAEEKITRKLGSESRTLSQRGAHLLPLDSLEASRRLSLTLNGLDIGAEDMEGIPSLPFDMFMMQVKGGFIVRHRAYRIEEPGGRVAIPRADIYTERPPLLAELVEEVGARHGWPGPDEYSPFLAAMDASRAEPFPDRLRTKAKKDGRVDAETPGGAQVELTRAQLRALARIYA